MVTEKNCLFPQASLSATSPGLRKVGAAGDEAIETLTESPEGLRESQHIWAHHSHPRLHHCAYHGLKVVKQPEERVPRGLESPSARGTGRQGVESSSVLAEPVVRARKQEATKHRDLVIWGTTGTLGFGNRCQQDAHEGQ